MRTMFYGVFCTAVFFCCFSIDSSAQLFIKMNKAATATSRPNPTTPLPPSTPVRAADAPPGAAPPVPTIGKFNPMVVGTGGVVTVDGTNFDATSTTVSFGGVTATNISVISSTRLLATVGTGASGPVTIGNAATPITDTKRGFIFAAQPTISTVTHPMTGGNTTIKISGTNFVFPASVAINGDASIPVPAAGVTPTVITLTIPGAVILTDITVTTPGGVAELSAGNPVNGGADLNLPSFGNGLAIVPTPSLDYSQIYLGGKTGFSERLWGNSLPTDSSRQKMGAKFLMPQISLFGFSFEIDRRITPQNSPINFGVALECNFLIKKVSDTTNKTTNNFNPAIFQPRLGFTSSFFHNNVYLNVFANFLSVVGSNDQFAAYFNTHSKNVFVFPEIDLGGLLGVGASGNQALKFELNLLVNNGDAQFISGTHDVIVPGLKIGFVTTL